MTSLKKWYDEAKYIVDEESTTLDVEDVMQVELPSVTVVTIVRDPRFIGLMLYNWNHTIYPPEKLEWLVLEPRSVVKQHSNRSVKRFLPQTENIRHIPIDDTELGQTRITNAQLRNHACELATHENIAFYDPDEYYPEKSLLAKMRVLLKYPAKDYVFSCPIGVYNLATRDAWVYGTNYVLSRIHEPTLAFRKVYWETHRFGEPGTSIESESTQFIRDGVKKGITVAFMFNSITISHNNNVMPQLRENVANDSSVWYRKADELKALMPEELVYVLETIRELTTMEPDEANDE